MFLYVLMFFCSFFSNFQFTFLCGSEKNNMKLLRNPILNHLNNFNNETTRNIFCITQKIHTITTEIFDINIEHN